MGSMLRQRSAALFSHRHLEAVAVAATTLLAAALAVRVMTAVDGFGMGLAFGLAIVLVHLGSDLFSGLVHWSFDRVIDERIRYLGPNFVRPFREHHDDPLGITRHDFIELNGNTCIAALPLLTLSWLWFDPVGAGAGAVFATALVLFLAIWTVLTNQFHQWAHLPEPRPLVRLLQRWHVVLQADHHAGHHREPFDVRFCITSGVLNPWLDRIHFFGVLERWVARVRSPMRGAQ